LRLEFAKTNTKVVKPKQQLAQLAVAAAAAAAAGQGPYMQPIAGRKNTRLMSSSATHNYLAALYIVLIKVLSLQFVARLIGVQRHIYHTLINTYDKLILGYNLH